MISGAPQCPRGRLHVQYACSQAAAEDFAHTHVLCASESPLGSHTSIPEVLAEGKIISFQLH